MTSKHEWRLEIKYAYWRSKYSISMLIMASKHDSKCFVARVVV